MISKILVELRNKKKKKFLKFKMLADTKKVWILLEDLLILKIMKMSMIYNKNHKISCKKVNKTKWS